MRTTEMHKCKRHNVEYEIVEVENGKTFLKCRECDKELQDSFNEFFKKVLPPIGHCRLCGNLCGNDKH